MESSRTARPTPKNITLETFSRRAAARGCGMKAACRKCRSETHDHLRVEECKSAAHFAQSSEVASAARSVRRTTPHSLLVTSRVSLLSVKHYLDILAFDSRPFRPSSHACSEPELTAESSARKGTSSRILDAASNDLTRLDPLEQGVARRDRSEQSFESRSESLAWTAVP